MQTINDRLADLRREMVRERIGAWIQPSEDPHQGEYVPARWKGREWLSGFDGSAGTLVVTREAAALWTDSRYFIAAGEAIEGTGIELMKIKVEGTPTIAQWTARQLIKEGRTEAALDGYCMSLAATEALQDELRAEGGITLRTNCDLLCRVWQGRPEVPLGKVKLQPIEYAGETTRSKLARIRAKLAQAHASGMLLSTLDDIAWTLNMRGGDVEYTPVFVAYLLIGNASATLFIDSRKLTPEVEDYLFDCGVNVRPYGDVARALAEWDEYNILMDPEATSFALASAVKAKIVRAASPVPSMKIVKNAAEIAGYRRAMERDRIALVKWLDWLVPAVRAGGQTEMSIARRLEAFRAEDPAYLGPSFATIAAYGPHSAMPHYEPTDESDIPVEPRGLLLVDSGGQYVDGTTDITRTIALGPLTDEERLIYTLVLKGHIQIRLTVFPDGAAGTQLDAFARRDMWRHGYNYLHGTGHGVGSYLSVHEGPHQLRMEWKPEPLREGMTLTDEPGIYLAGRCGARTENTLLIVPAFQTECGRFLKFDNLTVCPIDTTPVIWEMMTEEEKAYLEQYNKESRRD